MMMTTRMAAAGNLPLEKGQPIRIKPATFQRVPFNRLTHLRGKVGAVRRVIGREEGRALLEVEVVGVIGVCWDFEVREVRNVGNRI